MRGFVKMPPLYVQTILAMILGVLVGLGAGTHAALLGIVAQMIVTLIKAFATPLVFVTILESILDYQFTGKGVRRLLLICAINALLAMALGLFVVNFFHPGIYLREVLQQGLDLNSKTANIKLMSWNEVLLALIPESVLGPFVANQIPGVIILALILGMALRAGPKEVLGRCHAFTKTANTVVLQMLSMIVLLIPLAVFAAVAKAVGQQGLSVFKGLLVYLLVCCGSMLLHILIVYQAWIKFYARRKLLEFWRIAKEPVLYSFGINSSLVTLPLTLKALHDLKVSSASARLSACLGTNFNNDGILLYQVVAVLMVAQGLGIDLSLSQQLNMTFLGLITTLGVSGIPEAGVIALTILMTSANLPVEVIPLLLGVDWIAARMRSATNVLGDMSVAIALDNRKQA